MEAAINKRPGNGGSHGDHTKIPGACRNGYRNHAAAELFGADPIHPGLIAFNPAFGLYSPPIAGTLLPMFVIAVIVLLLITYVD